MSLRRKIIDCARKLLIEQETVTPRGLRHKWNIDLKLGGRQY